MFFISLSTISLIIHRNCGCSTIYEQLLGFTLFSLFLFLLRFSLIKLYHAEIYIHKLLQKQNFLLDVQFISSTSLCDRSLRFSSLIHIYMNVNFRNVIPIIHCLAGILADQLLQKKKRMLILHLNMSSRITLTIFEALDLKYIFIAILGWIKIAFHLCLFRKYYVCI